MKVAVSQAIPKRAIAEIMPALNTDWSGTVFTSGRPRKRIATPTTNITMTMVVVMSMGTAASPSAANAGRSCGKRPKTTMRMTPNRNASAELRPSLV